MRLPWDSGGVAIHLLVLYMLPAPRTYANLKLPRAGISTIGGMGQLEHLSLQSCVRLTDRSLESVAKIVGLKDLNIRGCLQVSSIGAGHNTFLFLPCMLAVV